MIRRTPQAEKSPDIGTGSALAILFVPSSLELVLSLG
jgi:hypothetical protein